MLLLQWEACLMAKIKGVPSAESSHVLWVLGEGIF
jgi:hypothetical protein